MGKQRTILAIDHGTSGVKASLVSTHGRILASDAEKTPIFFLPGGGAEQDPAQWWDALVRVSRRLVSSGVVSPADIAAICVSRPWTGTAGTS